MEQALVITDAVTSKIYAIATEKDGSIRIFGADEAGNEWAEWADARMQGRGKLESLVELLDRSFSVDGPKPLTRPLRAQIAQSISRFSQQAQTEIVSGREEKQFDIAKYSPDFNLPATVANAETPLYCSVDVNNKKSLLDFKGLASLHDQIAATMAFEVKRTSAVFDSNLASANGGWRRLVGPQLDGQITDRFERGCGKSLTRRMTNAFADSPSSSLRRSQRTRKGIANAMSNGDASVTPEGNRRRLRRGSINPRAQKATPAPTFGIRESRGKAIIQQATQKARSAKTDRLRRTERSTTRPSRRITLEVMGSGQTTPAKTKPSSKKRKKR